MSVWNAHEDHGDDDDSNCKLTFALSAEYLCGFPKAIQSVKQITVELSIYQTKKRIG